jgi:hypothetical protein
MRLRRLADTGAVLALAGLAAGCGTPTHLLFYQGTVIGVDVATSPELNTITAKLGYDRQTGTIIPKTEVTDANGARVNEAMSVLARSRFKIRFLRASEICERFATGQAAINMARQAGAAAALATPTAKGGTNACADW